MKYPRTIVAALTLSATGFGAIVTSEGFTDKAVIPVAGDKPTYGFGSTLKEDGSPVQKGDLITPQSAVRLSIAHIAGDEAIIKKCVTGELSQGEYDLMVDFAYQYSPRTLCMSSIVRNANAHQYRLSCESYRLYKMAAGRDCSVRANGCYGVWLRSNERAEKCLALQ